MAIKNELKKQVLPLCPETLLVSPAGTRDPGGPSLSRNDT
ncbi:hypothetical protein ASZ90_015829 [hydrocarbon metagenome]|uniref:Uncharacterized protein n=1 Tax=hydrocarbon metagenome TaxID=938273 RepID=A0A0W8F0W6_9ZZZZ